MQPLPYRITTSFAHDEANLRSGRSTVATADVDREFAHIETTISGVLTNLGLIQRDDGELMDGIVHIWTLGADVRALLGNWNPRGPWLTGTSYAVRDLVTQDSIAYVAARAHVSGVFADDLAAGDWVALSRLALDAASVSFAATGGISATDVQGAIAELDREVRPAALIGQHAMFGGL